ncbi:hypothetical protein WR25_10341 [Diploscapter pachys]|uniref:Homeobox domain-containing protein n=1 Tax=Diploscapter pachys TaxID=2018661 RepID=A0A2A2J8X8_9BILA|nr:hypothetical protein WR25_10341 [Diploscapter pachys]
MLTFNHILGQGRVNQLGGVFINGRPLPNQIRMKIVEMAQKGHKPCTISRQLRVSHGAVSKILTRFSETGSIAPGQIGGNPKTRMNIVEIEKEIELRIADKPDISPVELRQALINENICSRQNAPTVSSIRRFIRAKGYPRKSSEKTSPQLPHSIAKILGDSLDDSRSSSDSDDLDAKRNRTSFSAEQLEQLEAAFSQNTYPNEEEKKIIARDTGLSEEKIMTWFSNRRARFRKSHSIGSPLLAQGTPCASSSLCNLTPNIFPPFLSNLPNLQLLNGQNASLNQAPPIFPLPLYSMSLFPINQLLAGSSQQPKLIAN